MNNYVYVLFNKLSCRYESVMSFPSDGMALHRLSKNIDTDEFELCRIGSISIENGTIEPCPPVRLIWESKENSELPTKEV